MVTLKIPNIMHDLAGGHSELKYQADNMRQLVASLDAAHVSLKDKLIGSEGRIRPFVKLFINSKDAHKLGGLDAPLRSGDVVTIGPAIAGG